MLSINDVTRLYLGIQGENEAKTITIDVAPWLVAHPGGSVTIWHKRNGDDVPSATGAVFDDEAGTISWTPTSTDTYVSGEGEAEIRLTEGNIIKKSRTVKTGVSPAVTGAGVPLGSDWQSYINEVDRIRSAAVTAKQASEAAALDSEAYAIGTRGGEPVESDDPTYQNNSKYYEGLAAQYAAEAENARDDVLGMSVSATQLPEYADPTATYADGHMTIGIPKGEHGHILSETEEYQESVSGTVVPTGTWVSSRPQNLTQGSFLWIKRTRIWNGGTTTVNYESYYTAKDGEGAQIVVDPEPTQGSQNVPQSGGTYTMIQTKEDKVPGKGLSANDYTDWEKAKLAGIESGAQVNPGNATQDAAGLMSAADKQKLDETAADFRRTTVNGIFADADNNFQVDTVEFARQIVTDKEQASSGEFLFRTTGGDASLSDGPAKLLSIEGRRVHEGYIPEALNMTVNAAPRPEPEEGEQPDEPITATIDRDTFVSYVAASGTITLSYTSSWSADPALYGVTVSGTPISGDEIVIVYIKEDRGTIIVSNPIAFRSTGWNLYNHDNGYAKVKKYSSTYGYMIDGTYSSIAFAETPEGETTPITPVSGAFQIPADGYIIVTGGNDTDTAIWPTWSDWTEGYEGSWEAYTESEIDLSDIMEDFPYGLMQVDATYDEIRFDQKVAISRIERMAYTAENLAIAIASGRLYEADTDYIYLIRETQIEYPFDTPTGDYTASDHGMEIVDGGTVAVYIRTIYGENLVEKITHDFPEQLEALAQKNVQQDANLGIVETGNTATHAIAKGQYVIWKGVLCTADAAITIGETLAAEGGSKNLTACAEGGLNSLNNNFVLLWSGSSVHNKTITLSESIWNFKAILVVARPADFSTYQTNTIPTELIEFIPSASTTGTNAWVAGVWYNGNAYAMTLVGFLSDTQLYIMDRNLTAGWTSIRIVRVYGLR